MRTIFLTAPIFTFLLFGFVRNASAVETPLSEVMVLDGYYQIKVPSAFTEMKEAEINELYPATNLPIAGYADAERTIRLAFYTKQNTKVEYQYQAARKQFITDWKVIDPKLEEISNGGKLVDGRDMGYAAAMYKSPLPIYHFVFMCDYKGMLFVGELICPKNVSKVWSPIGIEIMNSVKKI